VTLANGFRNWRFINRLKGEIERMGRLRRFLPPQVADLIVASGSEKQLESHRHNRAFL
jgi:hypothetical protein